MVTLNSTFLSGLVFIIPFVLTGQSTLVKEQKIEKDTIPTDKNLSEIVITAQRTASDKFFSPNAIHAFTSKHLTHYQARTTPEALANVTGVFMQKTNHGGGSPFLRGLTGNQTLLLIDGIRLNNATYRFGPNQYLNTVDPLSIERVEVLRGNGSVAYGSDALGGTIQIFTKKPEFSDKKALHGSLYAKVMTQGMEQTGRGELVFSSKKMAVLGGLTYRRFGDLVGGDTTGKQSPSGYKEADFDIKSRFLLNDKMVLTVAHQNVEQSNVPLFHRVRLEDFNLNEFDPQKRQLTYARLDFDTKNAFLKKIYAITSLQNTEEGRNSRKNGSTVLRKEKDKVRSLGLSVNILSQFTGWWFANSGIEMYDEWVKSTRVDIDEKTNVSTAKRGLYPNNSKMASFSAFSLHTFTKHKWHLSIGGRLNGFNIQVTDDILGKSTLMPSAFVWNVGILRGVTEKVAIFLSANSNFRVPNIDDLGTLGIVDFRYETPNFNLNPEKSYNMQVGFKYRNNRLSGETYLYRNELRNIIARVRVAGQQVQGYPLYQKENVEKGYIQGIESVWKWFFTEGVNLEMGIAYVYGQNITKAEPMRRIPPLNGHLALNIYKNHWFSTLEILGATKQARLAQGDKDDNRIPKGGTPQWVVLNIYGGYSFKHVTVNAACQNLLNKDYRTHGSGINGVGRSASLGVKWSF